MAARTAIVEGDRNVLISAPTNNTLIVTGDRTTVEMRLEGTGAALAFAFRWSRPRARRRGSRPQAPPRFEHHVDRDAEVGALAASDPPRVANVYGPAGIGKTHVLVEALSRRACAMPDGAVYLDGRDRDADDLLHAIFEALFERRIPLRDVRIERHLGGRRALVGLEDVALSSDRAQRLALGLPGCRLFVTSRERVLFDGLALKLGGLAAEHAVAIAEQEFGRPLSGREQAAVGAVADALRGHPLALRQTFGRARDGGLTPAALSPHAASAYERAQALSDREREIARTLAVHDHASLGLEHIEALAGSAGAAEAAMSLQARSEARSHSPRYSLIGDLGDGFDDRELEPELDRALQHFAGWAQAEARAGRRDAVLLEANALLALLERASAAGRSREVIRLGLAIEGALAWGNRWAAWGRVLELVLAAARATADAPAEAAALHQLGTRAYGAGDARAAASLLGDALALRERIGDEAGARTTRQNLHVVDRRAPLAQRLSHLPIAILAAIVALLLLGAGVAGAGMLGGGGADDGGPPPAETERLRVSVAGDGSVTSEPPAIDCPGTCAAPVLRDTTITLTARSAANATFAGWSGACAGSRVRCAIAMDGAQAAGARFEATSGGARDEATLSISPTGDGSGSVRGPGAIQCPPACSATFLTPTPKPVVLLAQPAAGSVFAGWGGACAGTKPMCTLALTASRTVRPRFDLERAADLAKLAVRIAGDGTVTSDPPGIDCSRSCTRELPDGQPVTLTARAAGGWTFAGWQDPRCKASGVDSCVVTAGAVDTVAAGFRRQPPPTVTRTEPIP